MIVFTSQTPWRKSFTFLRLLSTSIRECKDTQTLIKLDSWVCSYDNVLPCLFPLFSRPYWSIGKSPGACPPEEATISVWMRGYRTVVWKAGEPDWWKALDMQSSLSGFHLLRFIRYWSQHHPHWWRVKPVLLSFETFLCALFPLQNNRTYTTRGWNSSHANYLFFSQIFKACCVTSL